MLKLRRPGASCQLRGGPMVMIDKVSIDAAQTISYEVVWWLENDRKSAWVSECEFSGKDDNYMTIGFTA